MLKNYSFAYPDFKESSSKKELRSMAVFPNLLKIAEDLTIKLSENPSNLESNFIFKYNIQWISNFSGSTSKLLEEHLWSPEQWLGTTALTAHDAII